MKSKLKAIAAILLFILPILLLIVDSSQSSALSTLIVAKNEYDKEDYEPHPDLGPTREDEEPNILILKEPESVLQDWVGNLFWVIITGIALVYLAYNVKKHIDMKRSKESRKDNASTSMESAKTSRKNKKNKNRRRGKHCPACQKLIDYRREVCQHCGHVFDKNNGRDNSVALDREDGMERHDVREPQSRGTRDEGD